jgi:hypothetical protein
MDVDPTVTQSKYTSPTPISTPNTLAANMTSTLPFAHVVGVIILTGKQILHGTGL